MYCRSWMGMKWVHLVLSIYLNIYIVGELVLSVLTYEISTKWKLHHIHEVFHVGEDLLCVR